MPETHLLSRSPSIPDVNPTGDSAADVLGDPGAQCSWSKKEEELLILFLCDNKDKQANGGNFRAIVWNDAVKHLVPHRKKGGVKTVKACQSKYARWRCAVSPEQVENTRRKPQSKGKALYSMVCDEHLYLCVSKHEHLVM